MTLVNSRGFTLESPCERGVFGRKCSKKDYGSWRRVAVDIRDALITGTFSEAPEDLRKQVAAFLTGWVDSEKADNMIAYSVGWSESLRFGDPDLAAGAGASFPLDPSVWEGEYSPTEIITYTEITEDLVNYTKRGYRIFTAARREGVGMLVGGALKEAEAAGEAKPPSWIAPVVTGGVLAGVIALGTWVYTSVLRARRGDQR